LESELRSEELRRVNGKIPLLMNSFMLYSKCVTTSFLYYHYYIDKPFLKATLEKTKLDPNKIDDICVGRYSLFLFLSLSQ